MKYSDFIEQEYADTLGIVEIMGQRVQLCDHMELIEDQYYATAMGIDVRDSKILSDAGVLTKRWPTKNNPNGEMFLFFKETHLDAATPVYDDKGHTQKMIARLKGGLAPLNRQVKKRVA
ncbi:MAG: hypothetical protein KDJ35_01580 [Alphaproteobacteria bacterium]|nr:hypothetical protein [Alphaproteobacteria bacterium]